MAKLPVECAKVLEMAREYWLSLPEGAVTETSEIAHRVNKCCVEGEQLRLTRDELRRLSFLVDVAMSTLAATDPRSADVDAPPAECGAWKMLWREGRME